jgi:hypothetical protein
MKRLILLIITGLAVNSFSVMKSQDLELNLEVDGNVIIHPMKGETGASWHALIHEIPLNNEKYQMLRIIMPNSMELLK